MFLGIFSPIQQYWLLGLIFAWAAFLFGGFIYGGRSDPSRRMPAWTRMASSATLVVAGFSWYAFTHNGPAGNYALFIAIGMTFGFLGDLLLGGLLPGGRNVSAGIISFGIGHIFYISAMLGITDAVGLNNPELRWASLTLWFLIGLVGWYVVVWRGAILRGIETNIVHRIALPYAILLSTTAGLATGLALQASIFIPLAAGAALFLISDLILAGEMFCGMSFRLIGDVIWLTYGPAQALIVYSVGSVLSHLSN